MPAQHGHPGGASAGHGGGFHSAAAQQANAPQGPAPIGLRPLASTYTGITPGAYRSSGTFYPTNGPSRGLPGDHRRNERNRNTGFVYLASPAYYPWLDYGSAPVESYGYYPEAAQQTAEVTASLLNDQMQRLSNQVEQMRAEQADQQPTGYPQQSYVAAEPPPAAGPPLTVVLRGGRQLQVLSYAVMGDTFWDFSQQPARRIPVSSIDVAASTKATEARGGEFPRL